jgi:tRNA dimethylallyltransferase
VIQTHRPNLISIVGPTAVGKTALAVSLAQKLETVIISADSRQFYREMKLGTAKPSTDEMSKAKHYFIDTLSINESYNAGQYERDALQLLDELFLKQKNILLVGGSGLYCKAIWQGMDDMPGIDSSFRQELNHQFETEGIGNLQQELKDRDPAYFDVVDQANPMRLIRALEIIRSSGNTYSHYRKQEESVQDRPFNCINIGLELDRSLLFERIDRRMDQMIDRGLFEEATKLYPQRHLNALQTVGYQEIHGYLDQAYDKEEAIRLLKRNSRRYAKRQMTWFKKDPSITWFTNNNQHVLLAEVQNFLAEKL